MRHVKQVSKALGTAVEIRKQRNGTDMTDKNKLKDTQ